MATGLLVRNYHSTYPPSASNGSLVFRRAAGGQGAPAALVRSTFAFAVTYSVAAGSFSGPASGNSQAFPAASQGYHETSDTYARPALFPTNGSPRVRDCSANRFFELRRDTGADRNLVYEGSSGDEPRVHVQVPAAPTCLWIPRWGAAADPDPERAWRNYENSPYPHIPAGRYALPMRYYVSDRGDDDRGDDDGTLWLLSRETRHRIPGPASPAMQFGGPGYFVVTSNDAASGFKATLRAAFTSQVAPLVTAAVRVTSIGL